MYLCLLMHLFCVLALLMFYSCTLQETAKLLVSCAIGATAPANALKCQEMSKRTVDCIRNGGEAAALLNFQIHIVLLN